MKKERKTIRFDYSKVESKSDFQYWGIHPNRGRLHIDTKRYKLACEYEGMCDHMPDGMFRNRPTPYLIPKHKTRYNYKYNIFRDLIVGLKEDWQNEYKPFFKQVRTPDQVYEQTRLTRMQFTSCSDDYDDIDLTARLDSFRRINKYEEILNSLYFQFIQKICVEINRYVLIVCRELGYKGKDFGLPTFYSFSDGLAKDAQKPKVKSFKEYHSFNRLNKINNFLKHNTLTAYETLKKFYPKNAVESEKMNYENGMYAGYWIKLDANYIDELFDKLLIFFGDWCKNILGECI